MSQDSERDLQEVDEWDAGILGCGALLLALRRRLRGMPGRVLKVVVRDAGARADLPAFCRMTGNQLVKTDPASFAYWIRARQP